MEVVIDQVSKRFAYEWIFRGVSANYKDGTCYAVTGPNGSGKSTYLKIISGFLSPSQGEITYRKEDVVIPRDQIFTEVSFAAPFIDLIEEFTLEEAIRFHFRFKQIRAPYQVEDLLSILQLEKAKDKPLTNFSSGMKQRVKLGLAILSRSSILLLDEPGSNLDAQANTWWQELLSDNRSDRIVIIASNDEADLIHCQERLNILHGQGGVSR